MLGFAADPTQAHAQGIQVLAADGSVSHQATPDSELGPGPYDSPLHQTLCLPGNDDIRVLAFVSVIGHGMPNIARPLKAPHEHLPFPRECIDAATARRSIHTIEQEHGPFPDRGLHAGSSDMDDARVHRADADGTQKIASELEGSEFLDKIGFSRAFGRGFNIQTDELDEVLTFRDAASQQGIDVHAEVISKLLQ